MWIGRRQLKRRDCRERCVTLLDCSGYDSKTNGATVAGWRQILASRRRKSKNNLLSFDFIFATVLRLQKNANKAGGSMHRVLSAALIVLSLNLSAVAVAQPATRPSDRPNVLFILIDDMGYTDLGCYGGTRAKTPAIDRLASASIRFTQFYLNAPICSPSRVALLTGQYPNRWRITSFLETRASDKARGMA